MSTIKTSASGDTMFPKNYRKAAQLAILGCLIIATSTIAFGTQRTSYNLDSLSWSSCDKCAGAGGNGPTATEWMTHVSSPSLDGNSAQFSMSSSYAYANALWWHQLASNDTATTFIYDVYFYIKNPSASQALEFDTNQTTGGRRYVYGTQCGVNFDYQWDVWDTANGGWHKTGIGCSVKAYAWNHLTWEYKRANGKIYFVAVTLNGVKHYVNKSYYSKSWGSGSELNVTFQMDMRSSHISYSTWLDKLKLVQY